MLCLLHVSVVFVVSLSLHCAAGLTVNYTQNVEGNATVVLVCAFQFEYPLWMGPPLSATGSLTTYNHHGKSNFNPNLDEDKLQRMSWADNKRDLVFNPVARSDEGEYLCYNSQMTWVVELIVRGICIDQHSFIYLFIFLVFIIHLKVATCDNN